MRIIFRWLHYIEGSLRLVNSWCDGTFQILFRKVDYALGKTQQWVFCLRVCVQLVPLRPEKGRTPWSWSQMSVSCRQVLGVRWGPGESCTCTGHSYFLKAIGLFSLSPSFVFLFPSFPTSLSSFLLWSFEIGSYV